MKSMAGIALCLVATLGALVLVLLFVNDTVERNNPILVTAIAWTAALGLPGFLLGSVFLAFGLERSEKRSHARNVRRIGWALWCVQAIIVALVAVSIPKRWTGWPGITLLVLAPIWSIVNAALAWRWKERPWQTTAVTLVAIVLAGVSWLGVYALWELAQRP